jgi:hypothetical protein
LVKNLWVILFFCFSLDARLYFIHIPKTAGSTMRLLLESHLSMDVYPHRHYMQAESPISHELVSGHFPFWFCEKRDPDFDKAFKMTILRDPIERCLSFLRAKKRRHHNFPDLETVMKVPRYLALLNNGIFGICQQILHYKEKRC